MTSGGGLMIDAPGTPDRDDALWVQPDDNGWVVTVHVADVSCVVPVRGEIEREAATRMRTRYYPGGHRSMLPRNVEAGASLAEDRPGQSTCAVSFHVTGDGETSGPTVERGRLAGARALSYGQIPDLLAEPGAELHAPVTAARDCARALLAHRRQAGALAVYDLSRGWAASEDGTLVRLAQHERNAGYVIVQEVMIAANAAIAAWAVERDCPILYRAHRAALATPPRAELLADLDALSSDDGAERFSAVQENLATVLRRATYEAYLYPHFGLCLPAYTHATSPLRRFPDLATQRNLLAVADGTAPVYTHGELGQAAEAINRLDADRRDARNEREKRKAHDQSRRELDHGGLEKLGDDGFFRAIKLAAGEDRLPGGLQAEIHRRLQEGLLGPREAHRLLAAAGDSWAPVRKDVLARLASEPEHAISVVSQHGQHVGESPEWTTEPVGTAAAPRFATTVTLSGVTSATRTGPAKREARGQAAVSLLARIAGGDDISTNIEDPDTPAATTKQRARVVVDPDRNPVSQLNEAAQRGLVTDLDWDVQHEGPPHAPLFTATVSAACGDGTPVSATGQGGAKTTARNAAALALLGTLATACEPPDRIPGAEPSQHPQDSQQQGGDAR